MTSNATTSTNGGSELPSTSQPSRPSSIPNVTDANHDGNNRSELFFSKEAIVIFAASVAGVGILVFIALCCFFWWRRRREEISGGETRRLLTQSPKRVNSTGTQTPPMQNTPPFTPLASPRSPSPVGMPSSAAGAPDSAATAPASPQSTGPQVAPLPVAPPPSSKKTNDKESDNSSADDDREDDAGRFATSLLLDRRFFSEERKASNVPLQQLPTAVVAAAAAAAASSPADATATDVLPGTLASRLLGSNFLCSVFPDLELIVRGSISTTLRLQRQLALSLDPDTISPLTFDEVLSLVLYTYDSGKAEQESQFYFFLNSVLREQRNEELKQLAPYLQAFARAWNKLPPREGIVFRGIRLRGPLSAAESFVGKNYKVGQQVRWRGVTSVSSNPAVAERFQNLAQSAAAIKTSSNTAQQQQAADDDDDAEQQQQSGIAFVISVTNARDIRRYSFLVHESELLLPPNVNLLVTNPVADSPKQKSLPPLSPTKPKTTVYLQEIASSQKTTVF